MKVEIGGGIRALGDGWLNVDLCAGADVKHDLNVTPWPFADETVDALYSSHCIEHVDCPVTFLREVARICKVGATVEIRCPDPTSEMAMVVSHKGVVSINFMRHADSVFPEIYFAGHPRRLRIVRIEPACDDYWFHLARANPLFRLWKDEDILTWLPRTRHENRFHLRVEPCTL
jgi:SAM-dependent methyltransferase